MTQSGHWLWDPSDGGLREKRKDPDEAFRLAGVSNKNEARKCPVKHLY